jgi:hypothetical protein
MQTGFPVPVAKTWCWRNRVVFYKIEKAGSQADPAFGDIGAVASAGKILLKIGWSRRTSFKEIHKMFRLLVDLIHFCKADRVLSNIKSNLQHHFSNEHAAHWNVCKCRGFIQMTKIQPDSKLQRANFTEGKLHVALSGFRLSTINYGSPKTIRFANRRARSATMRCG